MKFLTKNQFKFNTFYKSSIFANKRYLFNDYYLIAKMNPEMETNVNNLFKDYKHVVDIKMHWGDMDPYGHLNNVIFFRYLETGRVCFLKDIDLVSHTAVGPILKQIDCRFRNQVKFPDIIRCGSRVSKIKEFEFEMEQQLVSTKNGNVVGTSSSIIVSFDYRINKKAALPDHVVENIKKLEGREFLIN
eukprot:TRINITY_DN1275_c2_g1_i1.p1 TRINITY_DN1275_c2_g1~~TRINITY_DN1275_c2_g1_i1.p1  ORF type:complete len:188 (+),score=18.30 TRINITY_DN1275_c2_g1_i1:35-598(+)